MTSRLRIVLLCPRGPLYRHRGGIWKKTMRYAPLTLTTLASLIPPEISADVRIIDEGVEDIDLDRI
ncbi:MAG TPA: radical SAM protein, partial [Thermoanaerobaculia bacterium]|nr:radical SAM protein [Thermoanaerobaculia bacterium]